MKSILASVVAATLVSQAGCGGDSGRNPFVRPTDSFNAQAAWKNLLGSTRSWTVSGTGSDNQTYRLTIAVSPATAAVFPPTGVSSSVTNVLATLQLVGGGSVSGLTEVFFDAGSFLVLGERESTTPVTTTSCEQVVGSASLPPTAVRIDAGDKSGALFTSESLPDCFGAGVDGTSQSTWSVEYEPNAGITYFCINSTERNQQSVVTASESDCVEMHADGTLGMKARLSVAFPGFSIVASN